MTLPIRTSLEDVDAVCGYLTTKPTGATLAEAKAVVDGRHLDGRKLSALKLWGLVDQADDKIRITDLGRRAIRDSGAFRSEALREVVRRVAPYLAAVERAVHRHEKSLSATDLASHWYEHFANHVADSDRTLNDQAICFFQIAQGADLGTLVIGRRGMLTRFEFDQGAATSFVNDLGPYESQSFHLSDFDETVFDEELDTADHEPVEIERADDNNVPRRGRRVFITHGENMTILDQVRQIVTFGKFEPVVAIEHETAAKPVPQKVMDDMRTCDAAVIHVGAERVLYDEQGNKVQLINENVLIEIGAAMALYGDRFVLLVEEGVKLPSNLQGLYECRYRGTELNMEATMKLLKAFNEFEEQ